MSRSAKKGPYVDASLIKKIKRARESGTRKTSQSYARASMIIPDFVGFTIPVHNGRRFIDVYITENMVGHRLGEFSPTRTFRGHGAVHSREVAAEISE